MAGQHTTPPEGGANGALFLERKHKPGGDVREYPCRLLLRRQGIVVVRFVMDEPGAFNTPIVIPRGAISDGYFWVSRPFNLYRIYTADSAIVAHRFDAVTGVEIGEHEVSYRDLALDWWVHPDGSLHEEDRAEFDALRASGALSTRDAARADEAARYVFSHYRHVIDEAERIERTFARTRTPRPLR